MIIYLVYCFVSFNLPFEHSDVDESHTKPLLIDDDENNDNSSLIRSEQLSGAYSGSYGAMDTSFQTGVSDPNLPDHIAVKVRNINNHTLFI